MRLANLPLLVVVVVFSWLVAGELLGRRRWLQTVATAAVVVQPQLIHLTATVNPDIALAAIWAAALYVMIRLIKAGPSRGRLAWLAALVALSCLTQPRGLALLIPAVAAVALAWRRARRPARCARRASRSALAVAGVCGVVLLVELRDAPATVGVAAAPVRLLPVAVLPAAAGLHDPSISRRLGRRARCSSTACSAASPSSRSRRPRGC